jgi:hypothetical protein
MHLEEEMFQSGVSCRSVDRYFALRESRFEERSEGFDPHRHCMDRVPAPFESLPSASFVDV